MSRDEQRGLSRITIAIAVANFVLALVSGAIGGTWQAKAAVRETAADVVREQWLATLRAETARIAADAAREAAERAVRDSVAPLVDDVREARAENREHRAMDDERHRGLEREVQELRQHRR